MAKLIVEEGGARRVFRMGKGVLTVGSGAEARLRLSSPDVAEIHFELERSEQAIKLRPRPGVVPPRIGGAPVQGDVLLAPGRTVEIGGARLWIEPEDAAPRAAPGARPVSPTSRRRPLVEVSPRRVKRGLPAWGVAAIILGIAGLALVVWWVQVSRRAMQGDSLAVAMIKGAEQLADRGDHEEAEAQLSQIPPEAIDAEIGRRIAALREQFAARRALLDELAENEAGTKYLDVLLKKYEARHLSGTPEPAKVRLFLKRCRTFRERWPGHPELDWVSRQEARFAGAVDLAAPPTWDDVRWEVKDLTDTSPRNYAAAFAMLDEFLARATGAERTEAEGLREKLASDRAEYAQDRLYQAQHEFEKKEDASKAIWWLVHSVAWLGDEAQENEAARFLVRMPDLQAHLEGYRRTYPELFADLLRNPIVLAWAQEQGYQP